MDQQTYEHSNKEVDSTMTQSNAVHLEKPVSGFSKGITPGH
jgi:hypothetical protein